ncbi:hypothetical protein N7495_009233 [Penicillium taxi]|uniref:uncharacterized protein n=1 Tax=Penicillium taxi TaxID=168475 RepID=UPI002545B0AB|nr:uncharacterized protein N7495_009233 [Penicillium taxi]KAJ5884723.1 hypothetical protein N7495_009233 [Penicillium taxi]
MTRANDTTSKVVYKGRTEDFIVFVDDADILQKWKGDKSIALSDVLNGWKIFISHGQGILDGASKATLENEFGTSNEDEVMVKILEGGDFQSNTVRAPARERDGSKNDSKGAMGTTR